MTPRRRWWRALPAVAALGLLLVGQPAQAAQGQIQQVTPSGDSVEILFRGVKLGSEQLDPAVVQVTAGGRTLDATALGVAERAGSTSSADRRVMLVVDTSGSMRGTRIAGAKSAATSFLGSLPSDVQLGISTFSNQAEVPVRPTHDRRPVKNAIAALTPSGGTSLYDGVLAATKALGARGERRIVLLSDGADSSSSGTLAQAVQAVRSGGVSFSAVRFGNDSSPDDALRQLSAAGRGKVVAVPDAAGLARALKVAAREQVSQVRITAQVPAQLAGKRVQLRVAVGSGTGRLEDTTSVVLPGTPLAVPAAVPLPRGRSSWLQTPVGYKIGAAGVGLGLLLLVGLLLGVREDRTGDGGRTKRLLDLYTMRKQPAPSDPGTPESALGRTQIARTAVDLAGRVARRRGIEERLSLALDRAGVALRPAEWLLLQAGVAAGLTLVLLLVTGKILLGLLLGVVVAVLVPRTWLRVKAGRRQRAFLADMPDALQLIAGSLSAGYSLPQALDAVVREGTQPIAGEIGRAMAEARLGVQVEDALDSVAERMDLEDFRWVVMSIRVQREVGGNLAGVLTTVASTMRDRARLRRTVRALSAEGRLSAYVLVGLPIAITLFMLTFRRDYMRPLYTERVGIVMLSAAVLLVIAGARWMSNLVKVEV